jgi:pimeloyl-ACP methyl ester carboxylesterase
VAGAQPCFVLVHGAWHGGWCWSEVVRGLEAAQARCYAPTLVGLAHRHDEAQDAITADDHAAEIIQLVRMLDLRDVVLVLHSYAGMLGPALLAALRPRLRHIAWIEALIPPPGVSLLDIAAPATAARLRSAAEQAGGHWLAPPAVEQFDLPDPQIGPAIAARLTPHPWPSFSQPLRLAQDDVLAFPGSVLLANDRPAAPYAAVGDRARAAGWPVHETSGGHLLMLTRPDVVADFLLRRSWPAR